MDILSIYLISKITYKKATKVRLLLSAAFGAAVATALTLFFDYSSKERIFVVVIGFITSIIMTFIVFGIKSGFLALFRDSVTLWGGGALLAGIMTMITSYGSPVNSETLSDGFVPLFGICFAITMGIVRLFSSTLAKSAAQVDVRIKNHEYNISGIIDSGSFATEPISKKPVIIVKSEAMQKVAEEVENIDCGYKIRLIPISGIGGETLLKGFVPDFILLDGIPVDAIIAIDKSGGKFGGCDALIPAALSRK